MKQHQRKKESYKRLFAIRDGLFYTYDYAKEKGWVKQ